MNDDRKFIGYKKTQSKTDQHIISLAFMFGLFMPNGTLFYYITPLLILLLAFRYFSFKKSFTAKYFILGLILVSFVVFVLRNTHALDIKALLRNIVLFELLLFFPFAKNVKIPNAYIYFALIYTFISQISYMIGIGPIISFFTNNYPYEGDFYLYQSDFLMSKADEMSLTSRTLRLGGLFHNSNQCARYLNIILAVYLVENFSSTFKAKSTFLSVYFLAIVGTGSRTGFFISLLMLVYYIYIKSQNKKEVTKYIYIVILSASIILFIVLINSDFTNTYRFLDYNEGLEKSVFVKFNILLNYLFENTSVISVMFGNFSNDGVMAIQFDSEWGELIYRYGLSMIIAFVIFYTYLYRKLDSRHKLFMIVLLWVISSTLVLSYRTGFVFLLLLSKYSYNSLGKRKLRRTDR